VAMLRSFLLGITEDDVLVLNSFTVYGPDSSITKSWFLFQEIQCEGMGVNKSRLITEIVVPCEVWVCIRSIRSKTKFADTFWFRLLISSFIQICSLSLEMKGAEIMADTLPQLYINFMHLCR
jgi:hypothetical protein